MNSENNCDDELMLSESVLNVLENLISKKIDTRNYELKKKFISGCGENSYGSLIQLEVQDNNGENNNNIDEIHRKFHCILKLSPKNDARRKAMKVYDYYKREIFMYTHVLKEYAILQDEYNLNNDIKFNSIPELYASSLTLYDEYLILEDLHQTQYSRYSRQQSLTFHHTAIAIKELAKFHAMSFVLKIKKENIFYQLVNEIRNDNLFTENIEQISVEFGKKYMKKTIQMIKDESNKLLQLKNKNLVIDKLKKICNNFKEICIKLVNGLEPYAVICHGDFWNNNILYKYNETTGIPESAKLLDFQMARYSSPVLDFVHYLFSCTEKSLRDKHFIEFQQIYHQTLSEHMKLFQLNPMKVFPYEVFQEHLRTYGIYGLCMSVYAIPFFISDSCDIPDLDEVSEAIRDISESNSSDDGVGSSDQNSSDSSSDTEKCEKTNALLDVYEILNERTIPIFKRRMIGIVQDLEKYNLLY